MTVSEQELRERTSAPRVTLEQVEASIASEHYFTALDGRMGAIEGDTYSGRERPALDDADLRSLGCLTFCVLVLQNGFTVTGQSACADPANFREDIGRRIARQSAVNQIWPLLGYELRTQLATAYATAAG